MRHPTIIIKVVGRCLRTRLITQQLVALTANLRLRPHLLLRGSLEQIQPSVKPVTMQVSPQRASALEHSQHTLGRRREYLSGCLRRPKQRTFLGANGEVSPPQNHRSLCLPTDRQQFLIMDLANIRIIKEIKILKGTWRTDLREVVCSPMSRRKRRKSLGLILNLRPRIRDKIHRQRRTKTISRLWTPQTLLKRIQTLAML